MSEPVLRASNLTKKFDQGPASVDVLTGVDLSVERGERLAVLGRSGSGKSTLLHILGGLDDPDDGEVWVGGESMQSKTLAERARLRNVSLGFIYQFHHLLPEFDAQENVAMPLLLAGVGRKESFERAQTLLRSVGLSHRTDHRPHALSGGERQRVAVARALVTNPLLVLADEPTGNLDPVNKTRILDLLFKSSTEKKQTLVVVTHDMNILDGFDRVIDFEEFRVSAKV